MLEEANIEYFNPMVEDWNSEAIIEEEYQKDTQCDVHLYVVTPEQKGFFTFAEIIDSAYTAKAVVFAYSELGDGVAFNESQMRSLDAIGNLLLQRGSMGAFIKKTNIKEVLKSVLQE
jgi:hypothetical protein